MSEQAPIQYGHLNTKHAALPLVEIDFGTSEAGADLSGFTTSRLDTRHAALPLIEIDFGVQAPVLELKLVPDQSVDPIELAMRMFEFLTDLNKLDIALGGDGYVKASGHEVSNGEVTVKLDPIKIEGADSRIRQIVAQLPARIGITAVRVSSAA